jgi:hypothetical protein
LGEFPCPLAETEPFTVFQQREPIPITADMFQIDKVAAVALKEIAV